ncbi:hypothetical protein [Citrobacter phage Tr1]|nr:hypothetical protein [Citrobacter phage Tr1]
MVPRSKKGKHHDHYRNEAHHSCWPPGSYRSKASGDRRVLI